MDSEHLILLHLSDIHFKCLLPHFDVDLELRNELETSASTLAKKLGHVDGILVTGDVAFGGKEEEYKIAAEWLSRLSLLVGCEKENVWLVPGNHDVDWQVIEKSKMIKAAHTELGTTDIKKIDKALLEYLSDSDAQELMFRPINNFNTFAFKFGQNPMNHEKLYWEDELVLNDGSVVILRGLNSTIISDETDKLRQKVILSVYQTIFRDDPGRTYVTLCHHPPQWLRDEDATEDCLTAHVPIQLFGHKHRQRIRRIDNTLRLSAGAVHPSRPDVDWEPTYNYIALKAETRGNQRLLNVEVWTQVWNKGSRKFEPRHDNTDGKEYHHYELPLKPWQAPTASLSHRGSSPDVSQKPAHESVSIATKRIDSAMDPKRKLIYRLFSLPYHQIIEIAVTLNLLTDDDNVQQFELYKRIFDRAEASKQLDKLWDIVNYYYPAEKLPNPFSPREKE